MRHVLEAVLVVLDLGDVGEQADVLVDAAIAVAHGRDGEQLGIERAILAPVPDFAAPEARLGAGCATSRRRSRGHGGPELRMLGLRPMTSSRAIAGDVAEGGIDIDDAALAVGDHDAFVGVLEHAGRLAQLGVDAPPLGDVAHHGQQPLLAADARSGAD